MRHMSCLNDINWNSGDGSSRLGYNVPKQRDEYQTMNGLPDTQSDEDDQRPIDESRALTLSAQDQQRFASALLDPAPPLEPAMQRAFERRHKLLLRQAVDTEQPYKPRPD